MLLNYLANLQGLLLKMSMVGVALVYLVLLESATATFFHLYEGQRVLGYSHPLSGGQHVRLGSRVDACRELGQQSGTAMAGLRGLHCNGLFYRHSCQRHPKLSWYV